MVKVFIGVDPHKTYASADLPGADWWVAGRVTTSAADADVEAQPWS
jgi:hypothetical protein